MGKMGLDPRGESGRERDLVAKDVQEDCRKNVCERKQETDPRDGLKLLINQWMRNSNQRHYLGLIDDLIKRLGELRKIAGG